MASVYSTFERLEVLSHVGVVALEERLAELVKGRGPPGRQQVQELADLRVHGPTRLQSTHTHTGMEGWRESFSILIQIFNQRLQGSAFCVMWHSVRFQNQEMSDD